jgi:hypothetical protein
MRRSKKVVLGLDVELPKKALCDGGDASIGTSAIVQMVQEQMANPNPWDEYGGAGESVSWNPPTVDFTLGVTSSLSGGGGVTTYSSAMGTYMPPLSPDDQQAIDAIDRSLNNTDPFLVQPPITAE